MSRRSTRNLWILVSCVVLVGGPGVASWAQEDDWAMKVVAQVDRLAEEPLWPRFEPTEIPLALYDGQRTWLIRHPSPPDGFTPVEGSPHAAVYEGRYEAVNANTSAEIGGVGTAAVMRDPGSKRKPRGWAALAIHEQFHVFQREHHPDWVADESALFVYPTDDTDLLLLRRMETEALRTALSQQADRTALPWIAAFLDARTRRYALLDDALVAYERDTELNEGLARYVESLADGRGKPVGLPAEGYAADEVRDRAYAVGDAMGRLLDRYDADWKQKLDDGTAASQDELLAAVVAAAEAEPAQFDPQTEGLLRAQAERAASELLQRRSDARAAFLGAEGWQLVVEVADESWLMPQGFDPMNVLRVSDREVLHQRFVELANDRGRVRVLDRASLTVAVNPEQPLGAVRSLTITGLAEAPALAPGSGAVELDVGGVSLDLRGVRVVSEANRVTVTLGSAPSGGS